MYVYITSAGKSFFRSYFGHLASV